MATTVIQSFGVCTSLAVGGTFCYGYCPFEKLFRFEIQPNDPISSVNSFLNIKSDVYFLD